MGTPPEIKRIIELCNKMDDGIPDQRDIKKYLNECLLIKACVEYERKIGQIVSDRVGESGDEDLKMFVLNIVRTYRHLAFDSLLGNLVGKFSDDHKREFTRRLDDDVKCAYLSLVDSRNAVAHGGKVSLTYDEFKEHYAIAGKIFDELDVVVKLHRSDL